MKERFHLLTYGLALVLVFVGTKMLLVDVIKVNSLVSLGVVLSILVTSIVISLLWPPGDARKGKGLEPGT
jgi:tellurite resistance protein TerC